MHNKLPFNIVAYLKVSVGQEYRISQLDGLHRIFHEVAINLLAKVQLGLRIHLQTHLCGHWLASVPS